MKFLLCYKVLSTSKKQTEKINLIYNGIQQNELRKLKEQEIFVISTPVEFETSVVIGTRLLSMTKGVRNWEERIVSQYFKNI